MGSSISCTPVPAYPLRAKTEMAELRISERASATVALLDISYRTVGTLSLFVNNLPLRTYLLNLLQTFRRKIRTSGSIAPVKTHDLRRAAVFVSVDDRDAGEIIPLAKLQSRRRVPKSCGFLKIGCPFVHVPEEQPGFDILKDGFHAFFILANFLNSIIGLHKQDVCKEEIFAEKRSKYFFDRRAASRAE